MAQTHDVTCNILTVTIKERLINFAVCQPTSCVGLRPLPGRRNREYPFMLSTDAHSGGTPHPATDTLSSPTSVPRQHK